MASKLTRLQRALDAVAEMDCAGLCGPTACRDLAVSDLEAALLEVRAGIDIDAPGVDGACPAFDPHGGTCRAHPHRPLLCRLWGQVEVLSCPHGCAPSRWLGPDELLGLLAEVEAVDPAAARWRHIGAVPDVAVSVAMASRMAEQIGIRIDLVDDDTA